MCVFLRMCLCVRSCCAKGPMAGYRSQRASETLTNFCFIMEINELSRGQGEDRTGEESKGERGYEKEREREGCAASAKAVGDRLPTGCGWQSVVEPGTGWVTGAGHRELQRGGSLEQEPHTWTASGTRAGENQTTEARTDGQREGGSTGTYNREIPTGTP